MLVKMNAKITSMRSVNGFKNKGAQQVVGKNSKSCWYRYRWQCRTRMHFHSSLPTHITSYLQIKFNHHYRPGNELFKFQIPEVMCTKLISTYTEGYACRRFDGYQIFRNSSKTTENILNNVRMDTFTFFHIKIENISNNSDEFSFHIN